MLLVQGLGDLASLSGPEESWLVHHWPAQAPLRVFVYAVLTGFAWLTSGAAPSDPSRAMSHPRAPRVGPGYGTAGPGEALRNRVFFTFAFVEFLAWYWAWTTLRQDAAALVAKRRERPATMD